MKFSLNLKQQHSNLSSSRRTLSRKSELFLKFFRRSNSAAGTMLILRTETSNLFRTSHWVGNTTPQLATRDVIPRYLRCRTLHILQSAGWENFTRIIQKMTRPGWTTNRRFFLTRLCGREECMTYYTIVKVLQY